ncbi:BAH and coiled-coil domain-containing protein 1 isoform X2 [Brienomyrus brachyistius]|uniref:BAH and coiled-coil domain-containing protein 1 isoform X2 n=1 Tax=Brienomyrus brachyistius TaxID=42636 RepID=UPI0020B3AEC0|nr:BAH and coiled-coil domain-containing protein 1 isoform X2 [Brienomyrus brachyistius]
MEGRDFGPPPHLLSERGALVHRAASRIASTGHASVQHRGHFQTGKYYSSHLPMAPHSGGGLMGNSSASFMGTFLTSSLGSPASHSSGPPTSPSSPSFRGGTHSNASQIWFPHSHDAPGYPRFSGSLAHTFLPMSHLDHHGNSSVLYGQHPFYDAQKENFYLRGLPSQQPLISANHSLSSVTRTTSGQPLRSCSREHKSLKEATVERLSVGGTKDKERGGGKQEAKDRERHKQQQPQPIGHSLEEESRALVRHKAALAGECREPLESRAKQLSACLLSSKTPGGEPPLGRHPGATGAIRCSKEAISREMRISEPPADCLQRAPVLQHSVPYPMPPSVGSAANPGGFHCLPLHPSHSHHPPHPPYHSEFYSPPPPAPLANPVVQEKALEPKLTGPTFVPSVGHQDNKAGRPFQLGNPDCRRGGDAGSIKDKVAEKGGSEGAGGGSEGAGSWPRRPHWQQQVYPKADKAPAWPHPHLQQQPHLAPSGHLGPRPRSSDCLGGTDMDSFRASLPQGALGAPPYRDCSHMGPSPGVQSGEAKGVASRSEGIGSGCLLQRDSQKVARICHQQQARSAQEAAAPEPGRDGKQKLEMVALGYGGGQQQPVPPWAVRAHHMQAEEERRKAYLESLASIRASRTLGQQPQQQLGGIGPSASPRGPQGEVSAIRSLLKYSSQHQPHLLPQRTPFGGLGCLKSGTVGASCPPQGSKQTLPSKKGLAPNGDRVDCGDGRGREARDTPHREGEVRQPPVGIAVAVARHSEPPCHPLDGPSGHNRHGRAMPATKDGPRSGCSLEPDVEESRKRMCDEQLGQPCMEREQELLIRDNKKRVEFASIHPSSSCHGDLTSHIMVPGGSSLQSSQIGTDPSAHHPSHHHWMPQTGSPSLWMAGHSYGIGHSALHQGLPPGFSTPLPSTLQPVLPLAQDPSTPLVVLPGEPAVHPSAHHLDVIEQPGLWPPVYSACGAPSHIQHTAVYSRSQFLRQQELYALQQQQQQQQRAAQAMELQHRSNHVQTQKKAEDAPEGLDMLVLEPPRPPKPFSVVPSHRKSSSPGACTARLSPCCRPPSLRPPSTKSTPCPAPSPAAAAPHSPALSPALLRMSKQAERQDMRAEGQPPQDYPQSLEPDLPPGYTYPAIVIGYRGGPSPHEVPLAEPADLEAVQVEPLDPAPPPASTLAEEAERATAAGVDLERQEAQADQPGEVEVSAMPQPEPDELFKGCHLAEGVVHEELTALDKAQSGTPYQEAEDMQMDPSENAATQEGIEEGWQVVSYGHADPDHCAEGCMLGESRAVSPDLGCISACAPPSPVTESPQASFLNCWSLELLIAAAFCAGGDTPPPAPVALPCPRSRGMELLSELADLESWRWDRDSHEEYPPTSGLHSLATLATARALEAVPQGDVEAGAEHPCPARRTINLRRKCTWTPRHEPVCPVKGAMETMGAQELAMRVRLAELQRRYKEKQRELVKLQRKQEHHIEEIPRSPARRGPGRPRKRKSTLGTGPQALTETPRNIRSLGVGLSPQPEILIGCGEMHLKKKKLSNQSFERLGATQIKARCCKPGARAATLSSKLIHGVSQQKQKTKASQGGSLALGRRLALEGHPPVIGGDSTARSSNDSDEHSDTEEDEEDGSYDSEDADDVLHPRDGSASLVVTGPSPSSIVKLEANQKAKNKKERQGLSGSLSLSCVEGQVKVKKKVPSRQMPLAPPRKPAEDKEEGRPRRVRGPRPRHQQAMWGKRGDRGLPAVISERLKRATRKSVTQQVPTRKFKGRAVSRLLESFAANEGFQMDEDSSFSDGGEDGSHSRHMCHVTRSTPALPNCVLTKELLVDGLKVLISEDELLYAARIHTLELTDIYSITIDGERRSRQKIYSLEQLLQEAVLDVQPGSEAVLTSGQRVCAYWSERSRCLYPGYVSRGGTCEDGKAGGVMVEFDDGDRGRISLPNIRLLPPDYQIHSPASIEPPTLVVCAGQRGRRSSTLEKAPLSHMTSEKPSKMETVKESKAITKAKPGRPKGSTTKNSLVTRMNKTANPMLSWPADLVPKKKAINSLFQVNGSPRKPFKRKEVEAFSLSSSTAAPAKGIFRSSFAVDSFSSIANGYSSFGNQQSVMSVSSRSSLCGRGRRPGEGGGMQGRKAEFLVKLDHEGVTSPKTKNSKALLLRGSTGHGGQLNKGFDTKGVAAMAQTIGYSHPALLIKDNKKADGTRADLLLKGVSHLQKPTPSLVLADYADFGMNCHSDCPSSYSDMDEEEDDDERGAPMVTASGGLRTAGSFLSRLSVSSSSSGSSSSSSSGSLSSSSLCSSDNDSSYSSEDEEGSALLLQGCLSSHRPLLQPPEPASGPTQGSFVAKTMTVAGTKGKNDNSASSKPLKRKECPGPAPKNPKDLAKRQKFPEVNNQPKVSAFLPARQLWKWSGNPTQRRGMKGKARKLFYKAVVRGRETVCIGDCAVFLSAGRPHLPYVGRIESFWESWSSSMVVKVKWFYHPEETKLGKQHRDGKHALYQSSHEDENDVQTISHKCQVVSREEYEQLSRIRKPTGSSQDLYYLAGTYDPASGQLFTAEGLPILC